MCVGEAVNWYLIQTKRGKERCVHDKLATMVAEVFLPILKTRVSRQGHRRGAWGTSPLFPRYLFAKFDLGQRYFDVKYMPGVGGVVSAGAEPLTVPPLVAFQGIRCDFRSLPVDSRKGGDPFEYAGNQRPENRTSCGFRRTKGSLTPD